MVAWAADAHRPTPLTTIWRLHVSKRMTLIIGAMCSDGLYFCSDTEEGTSMGGKRSVRKLCDVSNHPSWHLVMGAAGFAPLCDIAMNRIMEGAKRDKGKFLDDHESMIGHEMKLIYDQYVSDMLPSQKRYDRQISLIIGIADLGAKTSKLYQTEEEIVHPMPQPFACSGVGQEIANYFLDRLFRDWRPPSYSGARPNTAEGEVLLQFVMREAKSAVGGVGGNTETFTLNFDNGFTNHGTLGPGWDARQPKLQDVIDHFWSSKPAPMPSTFRKSKRKR